MYIHPKTRQTFKYATPIPYDKTPQNNKVLNLDIDEHYGVTTKPVLRATPTLFEQKQSSLFQS